MHSRRQTSRDFSSRQQRMWRRNQNTVAYAPAIALGPIAHTVIVALMVAVLGLIYLTQVTKTSSYSYEIDEHQTKLAELLDQKRDLEVENARLQALERVAGSGVAAAMTDPVSTDYARN